MVASSELIVQALASAYVTATGVTVPFHFGTLTSFSEAIVSPSFVWVPSPGKIDQPVDGGPEDPENRRIVSKAHTFNVTCYGSDNGNAEILQENLIRLLRSRLGDPALKVAGYELGQWAWAHEGNRASFMINGSAIIQQVTIYTHVTEMFAKLALVDTIDNEFTLEESI